MKKYVVELSDEERSTLKELLNSERRVSQQKRKRAQILLKVDEGEDGPGWTDEKAADAFEVSIRTVEDLRKRLVLSGFDAAVQRKKQVSPSRARKLDESGERELLAIAQSDPPDGRARWTLLLLGDKLVQLRIVDSISRETVRKTLKKNSLQPHLQVAWVIPPEQDGEYVACMEDVLDVYQRDPDPAVPVLCMDEKPVQLVGETRPGLPVAPGRPKRVDYEYKRAGTANIFMFCEPLNGWREIQVTDRRTKMDWAHVMRDLLDGRYSDVSKVCLVMDNLNTHTMGAFYEAFPPAEARRLVKRLEIHYTPKHGSWLNIAENELSALEKQCLSRRIGSVDELRHETKAWDTARNREGVKVNWRFTIDRAREKLRRVYPKIQH